jgi:hypothetical protein
MIIIPQGIDQTPVYPSQLVLSLAQLTRQFPFEHSDLLPSGNVSLNRLGARYQAPGPANVPFSARSRQGHHTVHVSPDRMISSSPDAPI